jgi:hypothetical protein
VRSILKFAVEVLLRVALFFEELMLLEIGALFFGVLSFEGSGVREGGFKDGEFVWVI